MSSQLAKPTYMGDLGDGLLCRWSTPADQEKIGHLIGTAFRDSADEPFNVRSADVVRIVMSETLPFPFMEPGDFAVVEDTGKPERPLVACTCFWRHRWSYGGIPFGVTQPEMVATHPDYRNRGLVRALFEMIHARSAAEGHLVQAITGIPYFYRQFGYEYALDLGGRRITPLAAIPDITEDEADPYHLRLATLDDLSHIETLYNQRRDVSLVWHEAPTAYWRYLIESWEDPVIAQKGVVLTGLNGRIHMIVDDKGQSCGYLWLAAKRWGQDLVVFALYLFPPVNWQAVMPGLLRALREHGAQIPTVHGTSAPFSEIRFNLGRAHPAYEVLGDSLAPRSYPPYAWYLRVPDLKGFIQHIAPVLEARLADSLLTGYTGELKVNLYRDGFCLCFKQGRLVTVEAWRPPAYGEEHHVECPPLVFLQLLFGYRSLAELRAVYPDVWTKETATLLVNSLFPKLPSMVYSLDNT